MSRYACISLCICLWVAVCDAKLRLKSCHEEVKRKCYLEAFDCLEEGASLSLASSVFEEDIRALNHWIKKRMAKPHLSFLERHYLLGYEQWIKGDVQMAQQHWYRFLTVYEKQFQKRSFPQFHEVNHYYELSRLLMKENPKPEREVQENVSPVLIKDDFKDITEQKQKPKKNSRKSYKRNNKNQTDATVLTEELVRKGDWARQHDQWELAMNFYEKAYRLGPTEVVADRINQLKKLMVD